MGLLFLAAAALTGIGLVRRGLGERLDGVEQGLVGTLFGWMLSTWLAYGVARAMGRLAFWPMALLAGALALAALWLWRATLARLLRGEWPRADRRHLSLALILCLLAPLYWRLFSIRMFPVEPDGLYSGGAAWGDMALHLTLSSSFLYGENFPPLFPLYPPTPLRYPFLPDFQTAVLMCLGSTPWGALMATAVPLALVLSGLFHALAWRMFPSRATAAVATALFLFNGGLGFFVFLDDWRASRRPFLEAWTHLAYNYTHKEEAAIRWSNLITDTLLPQRPSLFGIPAALAAFLLFALAWRRWSEGKDAGRWGGSRLLLPAGILVGLLPRFHTHSYLAIGLVSGFLFLIRPRRAWLAFWAPAVLMALPQTLDVLGVVTAGGFMRIEPGTMARQDVSALAFWLRNVGVPLLLIVPAWFQARAPWRAFYLAFVLLFAFCQVVVVSPHDYDNIKLLYYWYGASCILIAAWLRDLAGRRGQPFLAAVLFLASTASGILAVQRESLVYWRVFSREDMESAAWVRDHTDPRALFLTAPIHNQPVACLAGRPILQGFAGWLWTHGYEYEKRQRVIRDIYAGDPAARALIGAYGIDYIYVSEVERSLPVDVDYLEATFNAVYRGAGTVIYDATGKDAGPAPLSSWNARTRVGRPLP